jgi:heme A synthase
MMVPPSREASRRESLRRIQVGAAGLAGVLMLVGLTNVVVDNIRQDNSLSATTDAMGGLVSTNTADQVKPTEPLADLGVTPASDGGSQAAAQPVPDLEPDPKLQTPMDRDLRQSP